MAQSLSSQPLTSAAPAWRLPVVIACIYVLMCAALLAAAGADAPISESDARYHYRLAQAFLEQGRLVLPNQPDVASTTILPLYVLFVAAGLWLAGGSFWLVVGLQIALLFATAAIAWRITERWLPRYGVLVFALVLFNPNALSQALRLNNDTVYTFVFTVAVWAGLSYVRRPDWWKGVVVGCALGAAHLIRFDARYLLLALVILLPLVMMAAGDFRWFRHAVIGVLATGCGVVVTLPWLMFMQANGHGLRMSDNSGGRTFLYENAAFLETYRAGIDRAQARARLDERQDAYVAQVADWPALSVEEQNAKLQTFWLGQILDYPLPVMARAFAFSSVNFFGASGAQSLSKAVGARFERPDKFFHRGNRLQTLLSAFATASPAAVVISVFALGFTAIVRVVGLIGLIAVLRRRQAALLLVICGLVAYVWLVHLFVGLARYRLPVEPLLMLLAAYGVDALRRLVWRRTATARPASTG